LQFLQTGCYALELQKPNNPVLYTTRICGIVSRADGPVEEETDRRYERAPIAAWFTGALPVYCTPVDVALDAGPIEGTLCLRSRPDRVACPEVCERFSHAAGVLHLHPVRSAREDETPDVREPVEEQSVRLPKTCPEGGASTAKGDENGLCDTLCLALAKLPFK